MAKILIVDDDGSLLFLFSHELRNNGFTVITAGSGGEGLRMAAQEAPDLILLDVVMPGMDGKMVKEKLSENPGTKNIPVIFLTALISEQDEEMLRDAPDEMNYISKQDDIRKVISNIRKVLEKKPPEK